MTLIKSFKRHAVPLGRPQPAARVAVNFPRRRLTSCSGRRLIAGLVAQGRSNPDIAAELALSRSTVQTHVSHILAKLGARSRAEIIRHVRPA